MKTINIIESLFLFLLMGLSCGQYEQTLGYLAIECHGMETENTLSFHTKKRYLVWDHDRDRRSFKIKKWRNVGFHRLTGGRLTDRREK